jgi:hypothetical protein
MCLSGSGIELQLTLFGLCKTHSLRTCPPVVHSISILGKLITISTLGEVIKRTLSAIWVLIFPIHQHFNFLIHLCHSIWLIPKVVGSEKIIVNRTVF